MVSKAMRKATRQHTKDHNTRLILRTIYHRADLSRAEIARITGLTRPTVSRIVADLIGARLVVETGQGPSAGGKRPTQLDVAKDQHQILALDLGSREFRGAVVNLRGEIINRKNVSSRNVRGEEALHLVFTMVEDLLQVAAASILGLGIGSPGLTNPAAGIINQAIALDWIDVPLRGQLTERFDLPIYIANDSDIAALGEYTFGGDGFTQNMATIKIGQGISAGIILNGEPYYGDNFGAGEIGHLVVDQGGPRCTCGNEGCLEAVGSTKAIVERAQVLASRFPDSALNDDLPLSWAGLLAAMESGDAVARGHVQEAGRFLGIAIANLIATLNIRLIVISGRVYQLGQLYLGSASSEAQCRALPAMVANTELRYSGLGIDVVVLGCAAMVLKHELGVI